jgi:hypothetical protein
VRRQGRKPGVGRRVPRIRAGRHLRRTSVRVGAAVWVAMPAAAVLLAAGAAWLAAVGVVLAVGVLVGGALRLRVAYRADRSEERWLRGLLLSLGDHPAEGEDEDLLVP